MPHTYAKIWFHVVFGTKDRQPIIASEWRERLHSYLGGTLRGLGGIPLEVGGVADHVHLLMSLKSAHRIDYVMRDLKADSTGWLHDEGISARFAWQRGYGAFTVSESQVDRVRRYIATQEEHHRKMTFEEELRAILKAHRIEFEDRYLWS